MKCSYLDPQWKRSPRVCPAYSDHSDRIWICLSSHRTEPRNGLSTTTATMTNECKHHGSHLRICQSHLLRGNCKTSIHRFLDLSNHLKMTSIDTPSPSKFPQIIPKQVLQICWLSFWTASCLLYSLYRLRGTRFSPNLFRPLTTKADKAPNSPPLQDPRLQLRCWLHKRSQSATSTAQQSIPPSRSYPFIT